MVAVERGSAEVMPLDQELYSQEAPDFVSENDEIPKAITRVSKATQGRGVWVMDRGGDRRKSVREWADGCRRRYREVAIKETSSGEKWS